jgi:hypothetical protein
MATVMFAKTPENHQHCMWCIVNSKAVHWTQKWKKLRTGIIHSSYIYVKALSFTMTWWLIVSSYMQSVFYRIICQCSHTVFMNRCTSWILTSHASDLPNKRKRSEGHLSEENYAISTKVSRQAIALLTFTDLEIFFFFSFDKYKLCSVWISV